MKSVYFLGTAYSGSTILGECLDSHPEMAYAGEVDRLVRHPQSIVPDFPDPRCHACDLEQKECSVWSDDVVNRFIGIDNTKINQELSKVLNSKIMIDGSKNPRWIQHLLSIKALNLAETAIVITTRSPMAFAESLRRRTKQEPWIAANIWRDIYYDSLRTASMHNIPVLIVRYEEFCLNTEEVLRSVCSFIGTEYDAKLLQFQQEVHHNIGGNMNVVAGHSKYLNNRELFNKQTQALKNVNNNILKGSEVYWGKKFGGWVDEKWKSSITESDKKSITSTPMLNDIANILGYNLVDLLN